MDLETFYLSVKECQTEKSDSVVMKKFLLPLLCVLVYFLFLGCSDDNLSQKANLYIEKSQTTAQDFFDYELYMVKYLEPGENAGSGPNIFSKCLGTTVIDGYEFYMFRVPRRELDIYVEASVTFVGTGAYVAGDYSNNRSRVNLKVNDWAKLVLSDHNGVQYHVIDGSGDVQ